MRIAAVAIIVAGCGTPADAPKPRAAAPVPPAAAPTPRVLTGCPGTDAVTFAQWTGTSWALRLGHRTADQPHPDPGPLAPDQLARYGIAVPYPTQWIFQGGAAPCRSSVTGGSVHVYKGPPGAERDVTSYVMSAIVPNCASDRPNGVDTWSVDAWAVGADTIDASCIFVPAKTRRGSMYGDSTYPPPLVHAPPVPTPYRPLTPRLACVGTCYLEWEIDEVPLNNSVARVKISRIDTRPRDGECAWPTKTVFGTYQVGDDEKTLTALADAPVLALAGAFVERGKPALLLYRDTAVWAVRTPTGPTRKTYFYEYDYGECAEWNCCCGC